MCPKIMEVPENGWFINYNNGKSQSKMDDLGAPLF
jgi:hypothetical protein